MAASSANASGAKPVDYSSESFIIEKYATDVTYAADGTGERVITVQVKVQSDAAVRQFGVLGFPYESRNESLNFVYVRVRKPDGSVIPTADSDAQDQPAEVTRQAPFYSDLRNKQLPVKSLSVGDQLEYQVRQVRTVAAAPGHFWYVQNFLKDAVVLEETASLTVPKQKYVQVESADLKPEITETADRKVYRWKTAQLEKTKVAEEKAKKPVMVEQPPSIAVTTFKDWAEVGHWYGDLQKDRVQVSPAIQAKANDLIKGLTNDQDKIAATYTYVSTQYRYIGVAFGIGRYQPHSADDVMQNQYGDCKDKHTLLASLLKAEGYDAWPVLVGSQHVLQSKVPSPGQFDHVMTAVTLNETILWMDSTPEVAPFRMLFSGLRDKWVLGIPNNSTPALLKTPPNPPFEAFDQYEGKGTLASDGTLTAHFKITARGDDELLYRIGFHQTPRVQWQALIQNVSYASGFAGTVSNIDASSPERLAEPFTYSYDYTRKEYADWANRRILALMPMVAFTYGEDDAKPAETILLGGPVSYRFHSIIELPSTYTAEVPPPAKIQTDFAEYVASYSQNNGTLVAERTLTLKQREIPVGRWDEYIKFEKAVVDEAGTYIQLVGAGLKQVAQTPSNPEASKLVQQAFADIQTKKFDSVQQYLDAAAKLNPKETGLWNAYSILYMQQGKREEGLAALRKEIDYHPDSIQAYYALAGNLTIYKRFDEAIVAWQTLLKVDPRNAYGHQALAQLLMQQKRFGEAVPVLEEAVAQTPDKPYLQVMLGTAEISGGSKEKGVATLKDVLTGATDEGVLNDAAYELADNNVELPLARASCEKALRKLDDLTAKTTLTAITDDDLRHVSLLAATWDTMAWILYRQGETAEAQNYAHAAWMLDQRPTVAFHLGQIYEKLGKKEKAIHAYQLAIVADYGGAEAADAQKRLSDLEPAKAQFSHTGPISEELGEFRSVRIPIAGKKPGSADFFVLFSPTRVDDVQFLRGDETLRSSADSLKRASYDVPFPTNSNAKILRRGILYCSEVLKDCQFTMLLPESTKRN